MPTPLRTLAVLALVAAISAAAAPAVAATPTSEGPARWSDVTVVLADGWRHDGVAVTRDPHGAGIWLHRADGARLLVAAEQIAAIYDRQGREISAAVLTGRAPAPVPPPRSPRRPPPGPAPGRPSVAWDGADNAAGPARPDLAGAGRRDAALFTLALGGEVGFAAPAGDWLDGLDPGWGGGARLRLTTHQRAYLGLGVRHQSLGAGPELSGVVVDVDLLVLEGTVGWISSGDPGQSRAYLELGGAYVEQTTRLEAMDVQSDATDATGAFVARAGVLVPLSRITALELGGTWYHRGLIFAEDEAAGSLLGLQAGLAWYR